MKGEEYVPSFSSFSTLRTRAINMKMKFDEMPAQIHKKGMDLVSNSAPNFDLS